MTIPLVTLTSSGLRLSSCKRNDIPTEVTRVLATNSAYLLNVLPSTIQVPPEAASGTFVISSTLLDAGSYLQGIMQCNTHTRILGAYC